MTKEELEKEAEEYAGTVHRYRDAQGETEQMEDVAEAWEKGYECCAKELEKENAGLKAERKREKPYDYRSVVYAIKHILLGYKNDISPSLRAKLNHWKNNIQEELGKE